MNGDQTADLAAEAPAQRQVRVHLTSKQEEIALPESTGPILVPTGMNDYRFYILSLLLIPGKDYDDMLCRRW
jgi:hypothetical protein